MLLATIVFSVALGIGILIASSMAGRHAFRAPDVERMPVVARAPLWLWPSSPWAWCAGRSPAAPLRVADFALQRKRVTCRS